MWFLCDVMLIVLHSWLLAVSVTRMWDEQTWITHLDWYFTSRYMSHKIFPSIVADDPETVGPD